MALADLSTFPPATARLDCAGEEHTLRWEAGELLAPGHGEPEGERALVALGGTRSPCIDAVDAWARHRRDARLLAIATKGAGDPVREAGNAPGQQGGWFAYAAPMTRPRLSYPLVGPGGRGRGAQARRGPAVQRPPDPDEGLLLLASLGHEVSTRLVATTTTCLLEDIASGRRGAERALPALQASLWARATNAISLWLGGLDDFPDVRPAEDGEAPGVQLGDGQVRAVLPLSWVAEVWGRGLAVVAGRLTISVEEASPAHAVLSTLGPDLGPGIFSFRLS